MWVVECNTSHANVCLHARKLYGCTYHPCNLMSWWADVCCGALYLPRKGVSACAEVIWMQLSSAQWEVMVCGCVWLWFHTYHAKTSLDAWKLYKCINHPLNERWCCMDVYMLRVNSYLAHNETVWVPTYSAQEMAYSVPNICTMRSHVLWILLCNDWSTDAYEIHATLVVARIFGPSFCVTN